MRSPLSRLMVAVCALAALVGTASGQAQAIRIKGSDTLGAKLIPKLSEAYKAIHKDASFEISAEGSSVAFTALANGQADIGMASRKVSDKELAEAGAKGIKLVETVACQDMIVVVVNKNNKVKDLSKEKIEKIFTGAVKDWSEVGGAPGAISVYTRNTASGTYKDWQKLAMSGKDYASSSQKMAGSDQVVQEVAANKNGIGYVGLAYVKDPGIHTVSIDGVEPVAAKVKEYVYSRECYYYTKEGGLAAAKEFVDFAIGEEGKKIVESTGFVVAVDDRRALTDAGHIVAAASFL